MNLASGYKSNLTVVFIDIVDSSRIVDQLDPEDSDKILNSFIQIFVQETENFKGVVNQILGDGIMALFGASEGDHNHALRALYCAHNIIQKVLEVSQDTQRKYGVFVKVRIGVNSGEVVIHRSPHKNFSRYRATGSVVHLADRIQKNAIPNGICISANLMNSIELYAKILKKETVVVKNGQNLNVVHVELKNVEDLRHAQQKQSFYLKRRQIENSLLNSLKSDSTFIFIVGEAGIGKTSIVKSLVSQNTMSPSQKIFWSFLPNFLTQENDFIDFIFDLCAKRNKIFQDLERNEQHITNFLKSQSIQIDFFYETLCWLKNIKTTNQKFYILSKEQKTASLTNALSALFHHLFQSTEQIFVFEDLHWARNIDVMLFDKIFNLNTHSKSKILCTSRQNPKELGFKNPKIKIHKLPALTETQTMKVLDYYLGTEPVMMGAKKQICRLTAGNPFYIKEIAVSLIQSDLLDTLKSGIKPSAYVIKKLIPKNIQDIYSSRLEALSKRERKILNILSILGYRFNIDLAQRVLQETTADILNILSSLEKKLFLVKVRDFPQIEYEFTHAYLQKGIYSQILKDEKIKLHHEVLNFIKKNRDYRKQVNWEYIAYHAEGARNFSYAYILGKKVARAYLQSSDFTFALEYTDDALSALDKLPDHKKKADRKAELYLYKLEALIMGKQYSVFSETLQKAQEAIDKIDNLYIKSSLLNFFIRNHWAQEGELSLAAAKTVDLVKIAHQLNREDFIIRARLFRGAILLDMGEFQKSVKECLYVLNVMPKSDLNKKYSFLVHPYPCALSCLAYAHAHIGNFEVAQKYASKAFDFIDNISEDIFSKTYISNMSSFSYLVQGKQEAIKMILEKNYTEAMQSEVALLLSLANYTLGYVRVLDRDLNEGIKFLNIAHSFCTKNSPGWGITRIKLLQIEVKIHQSKWDEALNEVEKLLQKPSIKEEKYYNTVALYWLAFCKIKKFNFSSNETSHEIISLLTKLDQTTKENGYRPLRCRVLLLQNYFKNKNGSYYVEVSNEYRSLQSQLKLNNRFLGAELIEDQLITA